MKIDLPSTCKLLFELYKIDFLLSIEDRHELKTRLEEKDEEKMIKQIIRLSEYLSEGGKIEIIKGDYDLDLLARSIFLFYIGPCLVSKDSSYPEIYEVLLKKIESLFEIFKIKPKGIDTKLSEREIDEILKTFNDELNSDNFLQFINSTKSRILLLYV